MVALIENSGFGGLHAAPAIRGVYDVYYRNTRHEEPPGAVQQVAKAQTSEPANPAAAKPATAKPAAAAKPKPVATKRSTTAAAQAVLSN